MSTAVTLPAISRIPVMMAQPSGHEMYTEYDIAHYYHVHDKKLGEGGFAKVRLATHLATRQPVAIKCLDKLKLGPELPRVYNEIECLRKLKHQNIARLYQVFETRSHIYLVLEYCAGGELFDYIVSKSKLEETESAQITHDLLRVLDFIHSNGFAHRDLKPENVLFDDKHQIKLIDFGLAANCSAENLTLNRNQATIDQLSTCCGSVTYAAPEVISGSVYSGTAVDVWSAGVMLYALLVGQLPFNDNSIPRLYQKIQAGIKSLPNFLSDEACDLIKKMLTVDPSLRITVSEALTHPWLRNRINPSAKINRRLDFGGHLDENVLARCNDKFPDIQRARLREYVFADFNYYSATYYLMLAKCPPRTFGAVKRTPDRQQVSAEVAQVSPTKRTRYITVAKSPRTPKTPPAYLRSLEQTRNYQTPEPQTQNNNKVTPVIRQVKTSIKKQKNHFAGEEHPKTTTTATKTSVTTTTTTTRSPIKIDIKQQENNVVGSGMSVFVEPTPKKSIVKRLLESATPSKMKQPRKVMSRQNEIMNISLTRFTDPIVCLNHFQEALARKGFQCKRKDFSLKCYNDSIRLTLEVCIYNNQCAVQRKRIKGDAWQYKMVCEEILRISNNTGFCNKATLC